MINTPSKKQKQPHLAGWVWRFESWQMEAEISEIIEVLSCLHLSEAKAHKSTRLQEDLFFTSLETALNFESHLIKPAGEGHNIRSRAVLLLLVPATAWQLLKTIDEMQINCWATRLSVHTHTFLMYLAVSSEVRQWETGRRQRRGCDSRVKQMRKKRRKEWRFKD